jgi:hypothetical protein
MLYRQIEIRPKSIFNHILKETNDFCVSPWAFFFTPVIDKLFFEAFAINSRKIQDKIDELEGEYAQEEYERGEYDLRELARDGLGEFYNNDSDNEWNTD